MGIADSAGKQRLICNMRYPNLFLEALPFKYERIRDILAFTQQGSSMATWDLKSGYYHVPIHPDAQKFFGFKVGGITFYFKVLCFGFAQACYVFTKIMQEVAMELRKRGIPVSSYINDGFTAAPTPQRCLRQSSLCALLLGALGAFLGIPKCQLTPELLVKWLGFLIDTERQMFRVSESKLAKVKEALREMLRTPTTSARKLAALAGKIIALSPAVLPAALYSRRLIQAMKGETSWDTIFPTTDSVRETATFCLDSLDAFNGRRWWPIPVELQLEVDASGVGFGGTITTNCANKTPFLGTFTDAQASESSTAREMRGYAAAIDAATKCLPSSILLIGDNQGAISALNHFRSSIPEIHESLDRVFQLCLKYDFDIVAQWVPRNNLTEADELSRRPDASDWGIEPKIFGQICAWFGSTPTVDLFASDAHHVANKFYSQFYTPGCAGVQVLKQDWSKLVSPGELAWIFPPSRSSSQVISLVQRYKIDAYLCIPAQEGSNELLQIESIKEASAMSPFQVPRGASSCTPSCRVPSGILNPAFLGLKVYSIQW